MNNRLLIGASDKLDLKRHFIQQDLSHGLTVIDPIGNFAEKIADCIPKEYTQQVNYFDPSDAHNIASFNVFENVLDRSKLVQDLVAFFDALFPAGAETLTRQNSNFVLANILTILSDNEGISFLSVLDFISDTTFKQTCLKNCTNPIALRNWNAIEDWDKAQRKAAFAQIDAKIGTLLLSPVMHRTLQEEPAFYFTTPILIANLSREKIGDLASRMLGTLIISRATTPVYINDFGFFASDHLASLFSGGGYTIDLQSLSDLPNKRIQQAVLRFQEKYVFPVTPDDAKVLQVYISGVQNPDMLVDPSPKEFWPEIDLDAPLATGRFNAVRKRSIARYTHPATLPQKKTKKGGGW